MGSVGIPMPWSAANQIPFYGASGPTVATMVAGSELVVGQSGALAPRAVPSRNILDRIDVVASDHTAVVKQAYLDYPHWHIPPSTTVKLSHATGSSNAIVIPDHGSLTGQDSETSLISVIDDPASNSSKTVFTLDGPSPRQRLVDFTIVGSASTPMTWTNGQTSFFYENMANADGVGAQSVIRPQSITLDRVTFKNYRGFPFHSEYARVNAAFCNFIDCGNGFNCNGAGNYIERCYFRRAEGIEMGGVGTTAVNNIFDDALNIAISIGGYFTVNHPEYHSGYIAGNRIYGSSGGGIIIAESMSDVEIIGNYIEDCTTLGIQANNQGSYLSNGVHVSGNHVVSCGSLGIQVTQNNSRVMGNRVYNRSDLSQNVTICLALGGDNQAVDGNLLIPSGATTYAVQFNGSTNMKWGPNNILAAGTSGVISIINSPTFVDAAYLNYAMRTITNATTVAEHEKYLILDAAGAGRTINIPSAVGRTGKRLLFKKIDVAAFNHTIDPSGSETIDGAATKVMSSQYAAMEIVSDGSNWYSVSTMGTVT